MSDEIKAANDELRRAYRLAFNSPAGQAVLVDLAPFCRAAETCAVPGDRDATYILEGRREVWLRIQTRLNLTEEDILQLALRRPRVKPQGDSDAR